MTEKINKEQLKVMIANQIKNEELQDILDNVDIESIINNILNKQKTTKAKDSIPEFIPEQAQSPAMAAPQNSMPKQDYELDVDSKYINPTNLDSFSTGTTNSQTSVVDSGVSGNIPAYTPELPDFMNKIEPGKIIVFDTNELSQGGENLSHTPFRTFEDPDKKKSINDMWIEDGKKTAEVYIVKLEKIGNLEFNYANGTSQFKEKKFDPDFEVLSKYKENPYAVQDAVKFVDDQKDSNILNQISTAVDLEGVVTKIVLDLIKKGMLSNSVENISYNKPVENVETSNNSDQGLTSETRYLFRGDGDINELNDVASNFDLNMAKLVDDDGKFIKTDLPNDLKEYIDSGKREYLKNENQEVEEWFFKENSYFLPKNRISKNKGYIFKN